MPKIKTEIYQCDKCEEKFFEPEDVLSLANPIENGDEESILDIGMYCPSCFIENVFVSRNILDDIIEISERVQDEIAANEKEDEEEQEEKMPWEENNEDEEWNDE